MENKFNNTFKEIIRNWREPFIDTIPKVKLNFYKQPSYLKLYNALICEDYNIFPVPRKLMNDILNFVLDHKSLDEKTYSCKDILNNYVIDWKFYDQFKENIKLLLKENCNCSITVCLFDNVNDLTKILNKYNIVDIQPKMRNGFAVTINDKFDVCLIINCAIKQKFELAKIIQHELIHWMQVSLNCIGTTYGKFKYEKLNLNILDKSFLQQLGVDEEYLLDEFQFQPWVANTCEQFIHSGITLNEFKEIIENKNKFTDILNNCKSQGIYQMYIFGMICYIASKRKFESYWYYLLEALKEN